jgi:hypothetical protein
MEGLLGFLLVALPIFFIIRSVIKKKAKREAFDKLPEEGPMKIDLKEELYPAGSFNSKRYKCSLLIKIQISKADWKAIADLGLMDKLVFVSPQAAGDMHDPDNVYQWTVDNLRIFDGNHARTGVAFNDVMQMQEQKESLITGLQNLRAQIDAHRHGPKTERLEI